MKTIIHKQTNKESKASTLLYLVDLMLQNGFTRGKRALFPFILSNGSSDKQPRHVRGEKMVMIMEQEHFPNIYKA